MPPRTTLDPSITEREFRQAKEIIATENPTGNTHFRRLTTKQMMFAIAYVAGNTPEVCYTMAYLGTDAKTEISKATKNIRKQCGKKLLDNPTVRAYIEKLREKLENTFTKSLNNILYQIDEIYLKTSERGEYTIALSALKEQAKLLGYYVGTDDSSIVGLAGKLINTATDVENRLLSVLQDIDFAKAKDCTNSVDRRDAVIIQELTSTDNILELLKNKSDAIKQIENATQPTVESNAEKHQT